MRKAFSETLVKTAETQDELVFITGDLGFQVFDEFAQSLVRVTLMQG